MRDSMPKFLKKFANFFKGVCGCEYLTQSKPSVVTLVNQISCGVQKQIYYIFVVVLCSFFLWFCCLEGVLIVCYHVESRRPLSWNRTNSDSFSSRKQKKSSQNTNAASKMKRKLFKTWIHKKFDVWCNRSASCFTITKDRSPSSYFISGESLKCQTSSLVDNTFTIFALKCLFEYFEEKAAFRWEELDALVVFI